MRILNVLTILLAAALLSSCAFMSPGRSVRQNGSIVDYLYPDASQTADQAVVPHRPPENSDLEPT